jgi:hypothetical protein
MRDADRCGARAAPASWAWLKQAVAAVLAGKSLKAAAKAANLARLPYRARKIIRWPGVPCWDPVEFVQLHNGKWVRVDQAPAVPPLDPQFVALLASDWLRTALEEMDVRRRVEARPRPSNASARRAVRRAKAGRRGGARQTRVPAHASRRRAMRGEDARERAEGAAPQHEDPRAGCERGQHYCALAPLAGRGRKILPAISFG